jgi:hypothetical protein
MRTLTSSLVAETLPQPPPAPIITITPTYNPYEDEGLGDDDEDDDSADEEYSAAEVATLEKAGMWTDGDAV